MELLEKYFHKYYSRYYLPGSSMCLCLKYQKALDVKFSMFSLYNEGIMYFLFNNLHDSTFTNRTWKFVDFVKSKIRTCGALYALLTSELHMLSLFNYSF